MSTAYLLKVTYKGAGRAKFDVYISASFTFPFFHCRVFFLDLIAVHVLHLVDPTLVRLL